MKQKFIDEEIALRACTILFIIGILLGILLGRITA